MTTKTAFITGVTGQDGAYLSRLLLEKGYRVCGMVRRTSMTNTGRLSTLDVVSHPHFSLHEGDMTDSSSLVKLLQHIRPAEIYHLAAQSHVQVSFQTPVYTANVNAIGTLRLLEAVRDTGLVETTRFYQASTSELFGNVLQDVRKNPALTLGANVPKSQFFDSPQYMSLSETSPFAPRSPYAIAKLFGYWCCVEYRLAYHLFACNGILFNHESPLRGETFVTRKITLAVARICGGNGGRVGNRDITPLRIGNLDSRRDWGHAADYVDGMWRMLQQDEPDDYVLATGESHTVREFIERAFACVDVDITWQGQGCNEKGIHSDTGQLLVEVDPQFYRPTEVEFLLGDSTKAAQRLQWCRHFDFRSLVDDMVSCDMKNFMAH